ncbi:T9SS type A sorting domain-containing protein [Botryobacter ruber]|uniref:T9SS type A sorting domain-containing protein n=1 Tax=Botryobacter ruber TaxID=2171629 RepID=UPI0013E38D67|nr:T9SS type A sorting domain-containing protein [Botryobacter ruber]
MACIPAAVQAQHNPGTNDPGFNTEDIVLDADGFDGSVAAAALQGNGKLLVGGSFDSYSNTTCNRIARLNPDRSLDESFNSGSGFDGTVQALAVQDDGKILAGGSFNAYNNTQCNYFARLNNDGSLDESFSLAAGFNGPVRVVTLQSDGKMIVGGLFTEFNGTPRSNIARLNADGTLDESFNPGTGFEGFTDKTVFSIALLPDGRLVVGGRFSSYNGTARNNIALLNTNGSLDSSFDPGTGFNNRVQAVALQNDGKIVAGGIFTSYNGSARNLIARLHADGSLDNSFNIGTGFNSTVNDVALQSNGKILVGGNFVNFNGVYSSGISRLNADGSPDLTFTTGAGFSVSGVQVLAVQSDGKIVAGGTFSSYNGIPKNRFARLHPDGTLEASTDPGTGFNNTVSALSLQPDGRLIVAGNFTSYNGSDRSRMARLNANGTLDNSFNPGAFDNAVTTVALQPDGKVLVGGLFLHYNNTRLLGGIARLQTDGTLDNSFVTGVGFNSSVESLALQPDGKVIVGGNFTVFNNMPFNRIIRLNPDGSHDTSFTIGTGFNGQVNSVVVQRDGKIVVGGMFSSYNGMAANSIIRLNADGSRDESFDSGNGFNSAVQSIALQADAKVLVGGGFTSYNGTSRNRIARLHADGTADNSFNPGTGFNAEVLTIALQPDGKVMAGGSFTTFNGTTRNRIARLNTDGSLDNLFDPASGFDNSVNTLALQPDGKVVVAGEFVSFNHIPRTRIARLYGGEGTISGIGEDLQPGLNLLLYPNPSHGDINLEFSGAAALVGGAKLILHDAMGLQVLTRKVTAAEAKSGVKLFTAGLKSGIYFLSISTKDRSITKRLVLAQ